MPEDMPEAFGRSGGYNMVEESKKGAKKRPKSAPNHQKIVEQGHNGWLKSLGVTSATQRGSQSTESLGSDVPEGRTKSRVLVMCWCSLMTSQIPSQPTNSAAEARVRGIARRRNLRFVRISQTKRSVPPAHGLVENWPSYWPNTAGGLR